MTTNALEGEPLPIYGDGKQIRDWLWVEDHCAGIELVLREGAPGEAYNVGGDDELENVEIVGHILRLTGADESLIRHVEDRAGHDRRYSLDTTKLRGLGWAPQKPFEEGIAETVAWYLAHRSWWEPIKSGEYRAYYEKQYAARLAPRLLARRRRRRRSSCGLHGATCRSPSACPGSPLSGRAARSTPSQRPSASRVNARL